MSSRSLPSQPNLDQYKKQAKELLQGSRAGDADALKRIAQFHPRFQNQTVAALRSAALRLADAQLVIAREHGFESWPKFASHIENVRLSQRVDSITDPVAAFLEAASAPLEWHNSGTLDEAEMILARHPHVATANIFTAAVVGDEARVRDWLTRDPAFATAKGGPRGWDPLTTLCFSRYLRLERTRSDAFVNTARALLDTGASAQTGWIEMIDHPNPRPIQESAIYGAAGIAQNAAVTKLLLDYGADPNDDETPYHVSETRDNTVLHLLLESGKLNANSLAIILLRKCDWHDTAGVRLMLEHGADPNAMTQWGFTALHQALRRDNQAATIDLLLDHGADPTLPTQHGMSGITIAAGRGRSDALKLFEQHGFAIPQTGIDALLAACARDQPERISAVVAAEPELQTAILAHGGRLLAWFSGVGNLAGVRHLLKLGIRADAPYYEGDGYFDIAPQSTALHVAAWRAWPAVVEELIAQGTPINALDGKGRTALQLAVKACVDSYWTDRRSPDSVRALLAGGASRTGIELPTGYEAIDELLQSSE